jgi:hypothetical protein
LIIAIFNAISVLKKYVYRTLVFRIPRKTTIQGKKYRKGLDEMVYGIILKVSDGRWGFERVTGTCVLPRIGEIAHLGQSER